MLFADGDGRLTIARRGAELGAVLRLRRHFGPLFRQNRDGIDRAHRERPFAATHRGFWGRQTAERGYQGPPSRSSGRSGVPSRPDCPTGAPPRRPSPPEPARRPAPSPNPAAAQTRPALGPTAGGRARPSPPARARRPEPAARARHASTNPGPPLPWRHHRQHEADDGQQHGA